MNDEFTPEAIASMFCDPFYCLPQVAEFYTSPHKPMVSEEEWIRVGVRFIEDHGAETFLQNLLKNLKGDGEHLQTSTQ